MTRLIVGTVAIYLASVGALVGLAAEPSRLLEPVPWYHLAVLWVMPEASAERIGALVAAGREAEGQLYAMVVGASFGLLGALATFGISSALASDAQARLLPSREAVLFVCLLLALALTVDPVGALERNLDRRGLIESVGIAAMPGYWIATIALTCALFARYATLMAHDGAAWARAMGLRLVPVLRGWRARPPARAILNPPIGFTPPPSWAGPRRCSPRSAPR